MTKSLILPDENDDFWITHIEDNLYMGGCHKGRKLPDYIKHVVSLEEYHLYDTGDLDVTYDVFPMIDYPDKPAYDEFMGIADKVIEYMKDGPTLVHCYAGQNRSGLICAAVLFKLGDDPQEAIRFLRYKRFKEVLSNKAFEEAILNLRRQ